MAKTAWQQRIRRAENLAAQHPFAGEILGFYQHVARFQEEVHQRIERVSPAVERTVLALSGRQESGDGSALCPEIFASFPPFLAMVASYGPERVAQDARELRSTSDSVQSDLLNTVWSSAGEPPQRPEEFLALAFLQPYAEFVRSRSRLQIEGYSHSLCPLCSRKPVLGVLRQQGDGGRRSLLCGFCVTEWEFRRVVCPGCGQEDHTKLPVYTTESFPYIRVECCDSCQTYIKSIDLTKNGLADPLVDEMASLPLDLWAQEHGYAKLQLNLLGM